MTVVDTKEHPSKVYEMFAVRPDSPSSYEMAYTPCEWLEGAKLSRFLEDYGGCINAPSADMTAVFWANRYSRYLAFFHLAVAKGYKVSATLDQLTVYFCSRVEGNEPAFEFHTKFTREGSIDRASRQNKLTSFYTNHVAPLFQAFASRAGLSTRELWGQVYHAVPYFIDLAKVTEPAELQQRLQEDWAFITQEAGAEIFQEKRSPFQFKLIPIPNPVDHKPLYTKPTCCLAYKGANPYCYRCPRMKLAERKERYQKYQEK
ncbi:hypothetical protein [Shouchella shacheensis]|uniref:hypothetical protein n=1 Tax=Shouchella shacheensis TaxID=1649580 RepID=UPI00074010A7|nr:hypothetical protein [Shouchella shacheensis]